MKCETKGCNAPVPVWYAAFCDKHEGDATAAIIEDRETVEPKPNPYHCDSICRAPGVAICPRCEPEEFAEWEPEGQVKP